MLKHLLNIKYQIKHLSIIEDCKTAKEMLTALQIYVFMQVHIVEDVKALSKRTLIFAFNDSPTKNRPIAKH